MYGGERLENLLHGRRTLCGDPAREPGAHTPGSGRLRCPARVNRRSGFCVLTQPTLLGSTDTEDNPLVPAKLPPGR
ncbi:hypothetical protein Lesp02_69280 [Lentzea sp. NBRC 105346]|nr:hypothetical protein Lesp02_69280 [Lentzea sp. NBRC 105346]